MSDEAGAAQEVMGRLASRYGTAAVALVATFLVAAHLCEPAGSIDEFLPLVAAQEILAGRVPYRDFISLYTPLIPYLDAAAFAAFAPTVIGARVAFGLILVATCVVVTRLAMRFAGSPARGALVGVGAALAVGAPAWGYPLVPAAGLALGALLAVLRASEATTRARSAWLATAGLLLGMAALARQDVGATVGLVVLAAAGHPWRDRRASVTALATVGGVASLVAIVTAIALARAHALGDAWEQLVRIPRTLYPETRALPWPAPFRGADPSAWPLFTIDGPLVVAAVGATVAVLERRLDAAAGARKSLVLGTGLVLALVVPALVRPDPAHVAAARLASLLVVAWLARPQATRARRVGLGVALGFVAVLAGSTLGAGARAAALVLSPRTRLIDWGPELGTVETDTWAAECAALEVVSQRPADAPIFVGLPRHDRIWYSDPTFYFDARALPATRQYVLHPWAARAEFQAAIVRELEAARPPFVVLVDATIVDEPNASRDSTGVRLLDDFIARRYEPVLASPPFHVLRRREP